MPWALTSLGANEMRMAFSKGRNDFDEGKAWNYGLFWRNSGQLVESAGLHGEDDRDCPEIGYSIRTNWTQKGWATESARARRDGVHVPARRSVGEDLRGSSQCRECCRAPETGISPGQSGSARYRGESLTGKVFVWLQRRFDPMVRAD